MKHFELLENISTLSLSPRHLMHTITFAFGIILIAWNEKQIRIELWHATIAIGFENKFTALRCAAHYVI